MASPDVNSACRQLGHLSRGCALLLWCMLWTTVASQLPGETQMRMGSGGSGSWKALAWAMQLVSLGGIRQRCSEPGEKQLWLETRDAGGVAMSFVKGFLLDPAPSDTGNIGMNWFGACGLRVNIEIQQQLTSRLMSHSFSQTGTANILIWVGQAL